MKLKGKPLKLKGKKLLKNQWSKKAKSTKKFNKIVSRVKKGKGKWKM